jgi:pSer/pThr/pTyr-binding forkhead associated (FHA) protein
MRVDVKNIDGICLKDRKAQEVIAVLQHGELRIGRALDNDLAIQNPTVSSYHAKIYTYLTASYIEDLDSTNGTFVDGKRIKKHVLKPGNIIKLGIYELVLEEQHPAEALTI